MPQNIRRREPESESGQTREVVASPSYVRFTLRSGRKADMLISTLWANTDVAKDWRPLLLSSQHCQNLVRRLHVRENPAHRFQLALMCLPGNLRHGVSDKDGAIVVLDPAAHGVGNANACGDACYNAGGDT